MSLTWSGPPGSGGPRPNSPGSSNAVQDLLLITWTVGAAGSVLVGQVSSLMESRRRVSFDAWRHALALAELHEHTGDAVAHLSAKDHHDGVRIVLLADLLDDAGARL